MLRDDQIRSDLAKLKEIVAAHKAPQADLATHREIIGGIEYDVFTKAPPNLYELYRKGLQSADETFLVYQEDRYTFAETLDRAARLGRILINNYQIAVALAIVQKNNAFDRFAWAASLRDG